MNNDTKYIEDANHIWKDFIKRDREDVKFAELNCDKQLEYYQDKFHRFTMTFPIVLRYMIQMKQYRQKAFEKYIKKLRAKPYRSELEYCERQADYVKYLFMEINKSYTMTDAKAVWTRAYNMLAREVEIFKKANEDVKQRMGVDKARHSQERRAELKRFLDNQP